MKNIISFETWLAPGHYMTTSEFYPTYKSLHRLTECFRHFLPKIDFYQQNCLKIVQDYQKDIRSDIYKFWIDEPSPKYPIHQQLSKDLIRTIGKHRKEQNINYKRNPRLNDDFVMKSFARILIYVNQNGIPYKQGFIDLLIPFYHFTFYGFRVIFPHPLFIPQMILVESIAANLFFKFLQQYHLKFFDINEINQKMERLQDMISTSQINKILIKNKVCFKDFAVRWFLLLFMQDLPLSKVFFIWDKLLETNNSQEFYETLLKFCFAFVKSRKAQCKKQNYIKILQLYQDISDIDMDFVVSKLPQKKSRKYIKG